MNATRTDEILAAMSSGVGMRQAVGITEHKRPWRSLVAKSLGPVEPPCSICDTTKHRRYRVVITWMDGAVDDRVLCLMCEGSLLYGGRL